VEKIKQHRIFFTPVYEIPPQSKEIEIIDECLKWSLDAPNIFAGATRTNRGGFQSVGSSDFNLIPKTLLFLIIKKIKNFKSNIMLNNWWININNKGDYNKSHTHPATDIAIVFYLTDNEGLLLFENPQAHSRYRFQKAMNLNLTYSLDVPKGTMILFPSDVRHSVEESITNTPRVSLAFNGLFDFSK
tara:strand:+ start:121 stop:681 length:561 start_codon:yes stop_codon:yes gene_type:complete